jgi:hypothetical protein
MGVIYPRRKSRPSEPCHTLHLVWIGIAAILWTEILFETQLRDCGLMCFEEVIDKICQLPGRVLSPTGIIDLGPAQDFCTKDDRRGDPATSRGEGIGENKFINDILDPS